MSDEDKKAREPENPEEIEIEEETEEEVKSEEHEIQEVEDPQEKLRAKCRRTECQKNLAELDECNERVLSKSETTEICFEELIDFLHCVDHCVAHDLFKYLK